MKRYLPILILALFLGACEGDLISPENYEYEEKTSEVLPIIDQDLFELNNINGNVQILGSDTASNVYLQITRRVKSYRSPVSAADHIEDIGIEMNSDDEALVVEVKHPSNTELDYEVDFIIVCPIIFDYNVSLGNGNLDLDVICRNLNVAMGNGDTRAEVIFLNNCIGNFETGNGNIELILPNITNAFVQAAIGNGSITHTGLDFENLVSDSKGLQGTLGNGEGLLNIFLGNGNIALTGY